MTRLRVWWSRLLDLVWRRQRESRLSEEIQTHLDLLTDQYVAKGMSPADARAAARREFGGVEQLKETYREQRGLPLAGTIAQDLRFALRMLAKDRRFTIATVFALGLGVAAVNAGFTVLNTMMIRELPFVHADRLVAIRAFIDGRHEAGLSYNEYLTFAQVSAFQGVMADENITGSSTIAETGAAERYVPERVRSTWVTANTFALLGYGAAVGRTFRPQDDQPGADAVAVISDELWRRRYGADPMIVGRAITIDDAPATIVGVMPPGFKFPMITQLWQPLGASSRATAAARNRRALGVTAVLRRGVTMDEARTQLDTLAKTMVDPPRPEKRAEGFELDPLKDRVRGGRMARRIGTTLMGASAFVLLIACANVASLLLARSMTRAREIAIRAAVGATRWRIVRQLLIECLLLASLASVAGAFLSRYGARLLASGFDIIEPGMPNVTPYWVDLSMDTTAYLFIVLVCFVTTIAFGLGPALHSSRANTNEILKDGGRHSTSARTARVTGVLITAEIALTLVLLTGAAVMWRTFVALYRADLVIDTSRLSTMMVALPVGPGQTTDTRREFIARLDERLSSSGRLSSVTIATRQIIGALGSTRQLVIAGRSPDPAIETPSTHYLSVGDRFFETVRLPIVRGRALASADADAGREGAVVNERFATRFFPNQDPIGQRLRLVEPGAQTLAPWLTIVGVARTIPSSLLDNQQQPVVYQSARADLWPRGPLTVVVADTPLATAASVVREEVRALQPGLAVFAIEPLDAAVARGRMAQKLLGTWLGILAGIGLVLASVGVYALTAHSVVQRTQEIGVRVALGAPLGRVMWIFLQRSMAHLFLGLALGMAGALSVGRLFGAYLLNAGAADYGTTSLVTVVLVIIALAASVLPARRAAKIDPMMALRCQ